MKLVHLVCAAGALSASGCATNWQAWTAGPREPVYILVKTDPEGATISFRDGTVCESPCRVGVVEPLEMSVARAGYTALNRTITRATPSPLTLKMEPVIQTQEVEEFTLPDL